MVITKALELQHIQQLQAPAPVLLLVNSELCTSCSLPRKDRDRAGTLSVVIKHWKHMAPFLFQSWIFLANILLQLCHVLVTRWWTETFHLLFNIHLKKGIFCGIGFVWTTFGQKSGFWLFFPCWCKNKCPSLWKIGNFYWRLWAKGKNILAPNQKL